ncbi:hypothetical protein DAPK24_020370 [Pichia kluyveri]|uniref:Uncharacterized protein n=1 Tax=Pichia kluyveri TaxID=36015 RepID=A0AAV5R379_PICKL|nr:hypothetical protein DAPK24_020370 [Pichia kluyveri]
MASTTPFVLQLDEIDRYLRLRVPQQTQGQMTSLGASNVNNSLNLNINNINSNNVSVKKRNGPLNYTNDQRRYNNIKSYNSLQNIQSVNNIQNVQGIPNSNILESFLYQQLSNNQQQTQQQLHPNPQPQVPVSSLLDHSYPYSPYYTNFPSSTSTTPFTEPNNSDLINPSNLLPVFNRSQSTPQILTSNSNLNSISIPEPMGKLSSLQPLNVQSLVESANSTTNDLISITTPTDSIQRPNSSHTSINSSLIIKDNSLLNDILDSKSIINDCNTSTNNTINDNDNDNETEISNNSNSNFNSNSNSNNDGKINTNDNENINDNNTNNNKLIDPLESIWKRTKDANQALHDAFKSKINNLNDNSIENINRVKLQETGLYGTYFS